MLAAITLTDLEQRIIPNKILLAGAVLCLAIAVPTDPGSLPERAIAAAAAGGILFLVVLAYPQGMGLGDVKLAATMGLFLGRAVAPAILIALLVGSRRRPRPDRPPRLPSPQDGDPLRSLPRPRRRHRHARRRPADRPLLGDLKLASGSGSNGLWALDLRTSSLGGLLTLSGCGGVWSERWRKSNASRASSPHGKLRAKGGTGDRCSRGGNRSGRCGAPLRARPPHAVPRLWSVEYALGVHQAEGQEGYC